MARPTSGGDVPTQACALALRDGCKGTTVGVDPCRVCSACRGRGEPAYVHYSVVVGRDCTPQVMQLGNAYLVDAPVQEQPKHEIASFERRAA